MGWKLILPLALLVAVAACGCGGDEDPNANLNAPLSKEPVSKVDAGKDRGMSPEEVSAMDEKRASPSGR